MREEGRRSVRPLWRDRHTVSDASFLLKHDVNVIDKTQGQSSLCVFLCHSSADKSTVRELYGRLKAGGIDAWLDEKNVMPGQDWQLEITRAIRSSDVVIVCLTHGSINKAGYIQKEIRIALDIADEKPEGAIFLIPVRFKECSVPERLYRYEWVDLFEDGGYERLLRSLQACALQKDTARRFAYKEGIGVQLGMPGLHPTIRESNPRHLQISFERTGNRDVDVSRLSDLYRLLTSLPGPDRFSFRLIGGHESAIQMDFPHHAILISEELLARLRAVFGAQSVTVI